MPLAALPRTSRLAGIALVAGLALAFAAALPEPAAAARGLDCSVGRQAGRALALHVFQAQSDPAKRSFFRKHSSRKARKAFLRAQRQRLSALKHTASRCNAANGLTGDSIPDPAPTPCSPSLFSAPYTEVNEGTTNENLPLKPAGSLRAVMLFVDFPDLHGSQSTSAIYNRLIPAAKAWYDEVSYGKLSLDVTPVNHWLRMPRPFSSYHLADGLGWTEQRDYMADAVAAADPEFDFSSYDVVYVVTAKGSPVERSPAFQSYPGDGLHADGHELRWGATFFEDVYADGRYAANVLTHETGHILGLPDLYDVPNPEFWTLFRFAGAWDTMSWNDPGAHFLAWEKWKLGWLDSTQLTCLDQPGALTTTISPLERSGGLKAVVVPLTVSSAIVVEARKRIGEDKHLCDDGVLVYSVDSSVRTGYGPVRVFPAQADAKKSTLFDRCGPLYNAPYDKAKGEVAKFEDESAGVTVRVLGSSARGYRVTVQRTSFETRGEESQAEGDTVPDVSLAPPDAAVLGDPFQFGLGWNLRPDLTA